MGGLGLWFYNVTTVGVGEGGIPCISVKYLIYLNTNKIKFFVKMPPFSAAAWALGWGQKVTQHGKAGEALVPGNCGLLSPVT